jgi:hypothetical protein
MLSKSNFSRRHIDELHRRYPKVTESVFEMSMYAFGLLELLADSRLDLIFKGGTSLMLLLKEPKRISTDIDILVPPHTDMAPVMLLSACLLQDEDIFHLKIQHRPGYHQKPYSYLNRTLLIPKEFDKAVRAIGLFDPKAR